MKKVHIRKSELFRVHVDGFDLTEVPTAYDDLWLLYPFGTPTIFVVVEGEHRPGIVRRMLSRLLFGARWVRVEDIDKE